MFYLRYAVCGTSLGMGTVTGRVAGQSAMEYLGLWDMWPGTLTDSRCNN